MAYIRNRKEREELWENSVKRRDGRPERFEREAWLEYMVVEDVRDKYFEKLSFAEESCISIETRKVYLEEKIRMAATEREKYQIAKVIKALNADLVMYNGEVSEFGVTYTLLKDLCMVVARLINKERFRDVVRIIPEHKLQKMARDSKGLRHIRNLVTNVYNNIQKACRRNTEEGEVYAEIKKHLDNVHEEAKALIGNIAQDDLDAIIREAESGVTVDAYSDAPVEAKNFNKM